MTLELNSLGVIPRRDEGLVQYVLNKAFRASLDHPPLQPMSEAGYKLQEGNWLLGVVPSRTLPGEERIKWLMWTEALSGLLGYTRAYPGYDFTFEIWLSRPVGTSDGYVIGTGFAMSRVRGRTEA